MDNQSQNVIWTNHVRKRIEERGFSQDMVIQTFKNADNTYPGKEGTTQFVKKFHNSKVTVIAKKNEHNEWIILSSWIDPPIHGTKDYKKKEAWKKYQKAGFWGKFFYILRRQMGI